MRRLAGMVPIAAAALVVVALFPGERRPRAETAAFQPPPDAAIPAGAMGEAIRLGQAVFRDPRSYAGRFVGNALRCTNCHLEDGRLAGSSPLWAAWVSYPAFRNKTGQVDTFEEPVIASDVAEQDSGCAVGRSAVFALFDGDKYLSVGILKWDLRQGPVQFGLTEELSIGEVKNPEEG